MPVQLEEGLQIASENSADKATDEERQSASLLQRDAEAVTRESQLKLTILNLIEDGHKAAAVAIGASIVLGIVLGYTLPVDHNIPGKSSQNTLHVLALQHMLESLVLSLPKSSKVSCSVFASVQLSPVGNFLQRGMLEQATFWAGHILLAGGLDGKLLHIPVFQNGLPEYLMFMGEKAWTAEKDDPFNCECCSFGPVAPQTHIALHAQTALLICSSIDLAN
jgi:hypothetical protein